MQQNKTFKEKLFPIGLVFFIDVFLTACSFILSYALCSRILPEINSHTMLIQLPIVVAISSMIFLFIGIYRGFVKYDRIREVYSIFNAICLSNILTIVLVVINGKLVMEQELMVPLSIIVVHSILSFSALVISRYIYKFLIVRIAKNYQDKTKAILLHNFKKGDNLISALEEELSNKGFSILESFSLGDDEKSAQKKGEYERVIIHSSSSNPTDLWKLLEMANTFTKPIYQVIDISNELSSAEKELSLSIKKIELEHLFPSQLNLTKKYDGIINSHKNQSILITGAGGCIGSAYAKRIYELGIKTKLILLDNSESALNEITNYLDNSELLTVVSKLTDIKDKKTVQDIFSEQKPTIVIHAAGNNVPENSDDNFFKILKENVLATKTLADIANDSNIEKFIFCSTVEAGFPKSTLEVSKKLAEIYLNSLNLNTNKTTFISLRINKVFDSKSSSVTYFQNQIKLRRSIDRKFFNQYEIFTSKEDVANTLLYLVVNEDACKTGVCVLNTGVKVSNQQLLDFLCNNEETNSNSKFNDNSDLVFKNDFSLNLIEQKFQNDLNDKSKSFLDDINESIELSNDVVRNKIESICLNVLFNNDNVDLIFELISNFAPGHWQNLHNLHKKAKKKEDSKIIKLQSLN